MKSVMQSRIVQALAPRARIARAIAAFAFAGLFTTSCDVHGISEPGTLASIVVSPDPSTLAINGVQTFTAVGRDASGAIIVGFTPTWSVAAGGGAITAAGVFTAGTSPSIPGARGSQPRRTAESSDS